MNDNWNNTPMGNEENEQYIFNPEERANGLPKKLLGIGIAGLVAVVLILVLIFAVSSSPMELVITGFDNSMEALAKNPVVSVVDGVANGGSMEVSVDLETIIDAYFGEFLSGVLGDVIDNSTASVKIYSNAEALKAAVEAKVKVKGFPVDAGIYADKNSVAIASGALLGKDAYGINLKDAAENFEDSAFGPDGAYSLGFELPENVEIDPEKLDKHVEGAKALAENAVKELIKSVEKNAEISKESKSLTFAGEETKTTAVTVKLDDEQMSLVLADMVEYIQNNEEIKKYLEDEVDIIAMRTLSDPDDIEEAIDDFYDEGLEDLVDNLEDMDTSCEFVFYVTKSGKQLVGVEMTVETEDWEQEFSVFAGPDLENLTQIEIESDMGGENFTFNYEVETDDKNEYAATLEGSLGDAEFTWNKKEGDFKLETEDGFYLNGTLKQSGEKTTIVLEDFGADGEDEFALNVTVTLSTSDEVPTVPKYEDVLAMSEEDIEKVANAIMETVEQLPGIEKVQGIVGNLMGNMMFGSVSDVEAYYDDYEEYSIPVADAEWG